MAEDGEGVGGAELTRVERRRRTEAAILDAARALFAERGYDRTGIRAVAERAGIDPALVMQHFGSKDGLFAAAARWSAPSEALARAGRDELADVAVQHVLDAFEDPERRLAAAVLLRSCLTHPSAQAVLREQVLEAVLTDVANTIDRPDAALRAALLNACTLGLTISRYLIGVPALAAAQPEDVQRVLAPALRVLVNPD